MVKKFYFFILLVFLVSLLSGCSLTNFQQVANNLQIGNQTKEEYSTTSIYLLPDQQNAYILDQSDTNGSDRLHLLNITTKKMTPLLATTIGKFYAYDPFYNLKFNEEVILSFKPKGEKYYGIWKFDLKTNKEYCLTKGIDDNVYLLGYDIKNNLVFFYNGTTGPNYYDLHVMDRSGNNQLNLASDFLYSSPDWGKIDSNTYYFSGTTENDGDKILLYNIPTKKTIFVSSSNYPTVGIYKNQLLVCHSGIKDSFYEFQLIDSSGKITKLSIPDVFQVGYCELDSKNNILIYTNTLPNKQFQIELLHLDTMRKEILSTFPNNQYATPLYFNKKENTVSFFTECILPAGNKMQFNEINIVTLRSDSIELNIKTTSYSVSSDCKYLFCYRINNEDKDTSLGEYKNGIIDTKTKQLHLMSEELKFDSFDYIEPLEKYLFTGSNYQVESLLGFVDKTGKVEIITKF